MPAYSSVPSLHSGVRSTTIGEADCAPVLSENPSSLEYGISTTFLRLDTSVLSPDPQTMPRSGLRSLGSDTRLDIVASVAAYGRDMVYFKLAERGACLPIEYDVSFYNEA